MLRAAFSRGSKQQRRMFAAAGAPLCAPVELLGLTWLIVTTLKPTAVVNMVHTHTLLPQQRGERQKTLCFHRRLRRTQCGVSNARLLSTNKDFVLLNLKHQRISCPSQSQVSSSLGKVNSCQSRRSGAGEFVSSGSS